MKPTALLLVPTILFAGCVPWVDTLPEAFRGVNYTDQVIIVKPRAADPLQPAETVEPGENWVVDIRSGVCESTPWLATTEAGQVLAEIPGACNGDIWTIRGLNDSTLESRR
jgi:hypothetical protein